MKRTLIQFDEETYHKLRNRAFEHRKFISSVVRELVAKGLELGKRKKFTRVEQFFLWERADRSRGPSPRYRKGMTRLWPRFSVPMFTRNDLS